MSCTQRDREVEGRTSGSIRGREDSVKKEAKAPPCRRAQALPARGSIRQRARAPFSRTRRVKQRTRVVGNVTCAAGIGHRWHGVIQ